MSIGIRSALTRREALKLMGAFGIGGVVAGCAGPGSSSGDEEAAAPEETGEVGGEISFAHWRGEDREVLEDIISAFTEANGPTTVTQDISPSQDYQRIALQRVRGGDVGDVFTAFRGAQFNDMVSAGIFTDLSGSPVVDKYQPAYVESGLHEGAQLGLPYLLVFNMPLANMDVLERVGVTEQPPDWDGFLAMCEDLKGLGVAPIIFPGGSLADANQLLNSMVMNNAPTDDMFAKIESGEYKCTDDWYLKTLGQYAELRPYLQPNFSGTSAEAAQQLFASGGAGLFVTGSYYIALVRGLGAEFPIDVMSPITVSADEARYYGVHNTTFILGVNSASDNQSTAMAFLEHLSDPEVAGAYANGTAQHITVAGIEYTNPDLQALSHWFDRETIIATLFQFNNLDVRSAVQNAAIEVLGGKDPAQAAEEAQRIVDQNRS